MFSIREVIDIAIQIEENGEKVYRKAIRQTDDPELRRVFETLIQEEINHADWFRELRTRVRAETPDPRIEALGRSILLPVVEGQSFSLGEVDFRTVGSVGELLRVAIGFEKDTLLFFEMLEPFLKSEADREHLEQIMAEEQRHVALFEKMLAAGRAAARLRGP